MFKHARSGSSFLAEALQTANYTCHFRTELTDLLDHSNCSEMIQMIDKELYCDNLKLLGGYSVNPFKFRQERKCIDEMRAAVLRNNAAVVVLTRDNFVAQTISDQISHDIARLAKQRHLAFRDFGQNCDPFHLYRCVNLPYEFTHHKLTLSPDSFVKRAQKKKRENNRLLDGVLTWFGKDEVFHIRFEQIITFPHHNMTLPTWILKCGICRCECDEVPVSVSFGSRKPLREKIENYDEVREHVANTAPELLPLLES